MGGFGLSPRLPSFTPDRPLVKGVVDPAAKAELGAKMRERKQKQLTMDQLRQGWRDRLGTDEQAQVHRIAGTIGSGPRPADPLRGAEAVALAVDQCFERSSVVPERTVLATALRRGLDTSSLAVIAAEVARLGAVAVMVRCFGPENAACPTVALAPRASRHFHQSFHVAFRHALR